MKFMNYEIKFGIEATTKSGILKKIKEVQQSSDDEVQQSDGDFVDDIEMMLNMVPEFLLVGLQKDIRMSLDTIITQIKARKKQQQRYAN